MDCSRKKHMLFDDPLDLHLAEKNRFCPRSGLFVFCHGFPGVKNSFGAQTNFIFSFS